MRLLCGTIRRARITGHPSAGFVQGAALPLVIPRGGRRQHHMSHIVGVFGDMEPELTGKPRQDKTRPAG